MKSYKASDEAGRNWLVYEGDVAWSICHALNAAGVKLIILPAETLLHGRLPDVPIPVPPISISELITDDIREWYKTRVRMADCVNYLQRLIFDAIP